MLDSLIKGYYIYEETFLLLRNQRPPYPRGCAFGQNKIVFPLRERRTQQHPMKKLEEFLKDQQFGKNKQG